MFRSTALEILEMVQPSPESIHFFEISHHERHNKRQQFWEQEHAFFADEEILVSALRCW